MQAKRSAVGRRRVRELCARQIKRVAIERRTQKRNANVLIGRGLGWRIHGSVEDTKLSTNKQHSLSAISALRRNRGGHLESCLQSLGHHRDITWTVLKQLGLRVFETRTRLQIGPLFIIRESVIRRIGREHTGKRSKRSLLRYNPKH
jgi:hypothetical protein